MGFWDTDGVEADRRDRVSNRVSRRKKITEVIEANRSLPRFSGQLEETVHGVMGRSKKLRWVCLDPCAATLSVWCGPPVGHDAAVEEAVIHEAPDSEKCGICLEGAFDERILCWARARYM